MPAMLPAATTETETFQLLPASRFSIEQLTGIYNRTRVDYLVPMTMNAAHLAGYVQLYSVDLDHSLVAVQNGELLGVAMLGVRNNRAWVTRLGVIPTTRRNGMGKALVSGLLDQAASLGLDFAMLEVIKDNAPAHGLFLKSGFYEVGELLVLRRPPAMPSLQPLAADVQTLARAGALALVRRDRSPQPWTNQLESLENARGIFGLHLTLPDGDRGWLVYQRHKSTLSHFVFKTEQGNPAALAEAFLSHLHSRFPHLDTQVENIRVTDPHLSAFYKMGYMESFRRIEMWRGAPPPELDLRVDG